MSNFLWLDDERNPPGPDWAWAKTALEAIKLLRCQRFSIISLDHDLGEDAGTGYQVLLYLESEVFRNPEFECPEIRLHTANTVGRQRMQQAIDSIARLQARH